MNCKNAIHGVCFVYREIQAEDMFFQRVKELVKKDGVAETLKAEKQILWVQRINAVRETAAEIVNTYVVYK